LPFVKGLLHLVFTQKTASCLIGQLNAHLVYRFANGQQAHSTDIPTRALAGSGNFLPDHRQIMSEIVNG